MTRAWPSRRARSISSAAAPSTHPPLTEPAILPSSAQSRTAPSGRGAEPNVRTTTARPKSTPSDRKAPTTSSSSFTASSPEGPGHGAAHGGRANGPRHPSRRARRRGARAENGPARRRRPHARQLGMAAGGSPPRGLVRQEGGEALEAGGGAGCDEVVDERVGGGHPG